MHGKRVLITGGTGYIGSDLVEKLLSEGNVKIALIVRDIQKAKNIFEERVEYILNEELAVFKSNVEAFAPEVVVHLAAYSTSSDEPKEIATLIESNIIFTSNLLLAIDNCEIDLFINAGSFSEYHNSNTTLSPTYFYSATKISSRYIIEYYSKKNGFKFINATLFTVYGKENSSKKIIDYAIDALNAEVAVKMSDGKQILDFIHIDDVVLFYYSLIVKCETIKLSKIDYDIGTGKCISIRELVQNLEKLTGKKANIEWGSNKSRKLDTIRACADIKLSEEELNYEVTVLLNDGLSRYIQEKGES